MGKAPEDLPLDPASHDDRDQPWFQFCEEIDQLLDTGEYAWAFDTLTGIQDSVRAYRVVTDGQRRAVENIRTARDRKEGGFSRRYEGFDRKRGGW
jgi:hypothetical protein